MVGNQVGHDIISFSRQLHIYINSSLQFSFKYKGPMDKDNGAGEV